MSVCQHPIPMQRLSDLLGRGGPISAEEQREVLALAHACYESWCLRPSLCSSVEIRVAGLVLLARASLRAGRARQALIHARRGWRLLRDHVARQRMVPVLLEILIASAEACDRQAAEHWRHIAWASGHTALAPEPGVAAASLAS